MRVLLVFVLLLMTIAQSASLSEDRSGRTNWKFFQDLKKRAHSLVSGNKYHHNTEHLMHTGDNKEGAAKIIGRHVSSHCLKAEKPGKIYFSGASDRPVEVFFGTKPGLEAFLANPDSEEHKPEARETATKEWGMAVEVKKGDERCVWVAHASKFVAADITYKLRSPEAVAEPSPEPGAEAEAEPQTEPEPEPEPEPEAEEPSAPRIPAFSKLESCYPQGSADEVKKRIGGLCNAGWVTNTCAVRMSKTLECAGAPIPSSIVGAGDQGLHTCRAGNRKRIAYRVKELYKYHMLPKYGKATIEHGPRPGTNRGVDMKPFLKHKGIIRFDTTGTWSDASGHFDLFNGEEMVEANHRGRANLEKYFGYSTKVQLWESPTE